MIYKGIIIKFNDEIFRKERLIKAVDALYEYTNDNLIRQIDMLEDNKGELIVHWNKKPTTFEELIIETTWDDLFESNIKHIIIKCKCCNSKPYKEDDEIKNYFQSLYNEQ
jgi:hypothetical protein